MFKTWSLPVALLVCVGLTTWLLNWIDSDSGISKKPGAHESDSYMKNFTRTAMDESGNVQNRLRAALMTHYPYDDSSELVSPWLEIYNGEDQPWTVIAERAWVSAHHEVILLHGGVQIWRTDDTGGREIELHTEELKVLPQTKQAENDMPTTIITPESVTHGIGMRADLRIKHFELLQRVHSRHEARHRG